MKKKALFLLVLMLIPVLFSISNVYSFSYGSVLMLYRIWKDGKWGYNAEISFIPSGKIYVKMDKNEYIQLFSHSKQVIPYEITIQGKTVNFTIDFYFVVGNSYAVSDNYVYINSSGIYAGNYETNTLKFIEKSKETLTITYTNDKRLIINDIEIVQNDLSYSTSWTRIISQGKSEFTIISFSYELQGGYRYTDDYDALFPNEKLGKYIFYRKPKTNYEYTVYIKITTNGKVPVYTDDNPKTPSEMNYAKAVSIYRFFGNVYLKDYINIYNNNTHFLLRIASALRRTSSGDVIVWHGTWAKVYERPYNTIGYIEIFSSYNYTSESKYVHKIRIHLVSVYAYTLEDYTVTLTYNPESNNVNFDSSSYDAFVDPSYLVCPFVDSDKHSFTFEIRFQSKTPTQQQQNDLGWLQPIADFFLWIINGIISIFRGLFDFLYSGITSIGNLISNAISQWINWLSEQVGNLFNEWFNWLYEQTIGFFEKVKDFFENIYEWGIKVFDFLYQVANTLYDIIVNDLIPFIINSINTAINFLEFLYNLLLQLPNYFSIFVEFLMFILDITSNLFYFIPTLISIAPLFIILWIAEPIINLDAKELLERFIKLGLILYKIIDYIIEWIRKIVDTIGNYIPFT